MYIRIKSPHLGIDIASSSIDSDVVEKVLQVVENIEYRYLEHQDISVSLYARRDSGENFVRLSAGDVVELRYSDEERKISELEFVERQVCETPSRLLNSAIDIIVTEVERIARIKASPCGGDRHSIQICEDRYGYVVADLHAFDAITGGEDRLYILKPLAKVLDEARSQARRFRKIYEAIEEAVKRSPRALVKHVLSELSKRVDTDIVTAMKHGNSAVLASKIFSYGDLAKRIVINQNTVCFTKIEI